MNGEEPLVCGQGSSLTCVVVATWVLALQFFNKQYLHVLCTFLYMGCISQYNQVQKYFLLDKWKSKYTNLLLTEPIGSIIVFS